MRRDGGGSATTDGGTGALAAVRAAGGLRGAELIVACDVTTPFERAATVYGPQKGADPSAVERLTARLHAQAAELDRDPRGVPMTGAAGGLAGGLWGAPARRWSRVRRGCWTCSASASASRAPTLSSPARDAWTARP